MQDCDLIHRHSLLTGVYYRGSREKGREVNEMDWTHEVMAEVEPGTLNPIVGGQTGRGSEGYAQAQERAQRLNTRYEPASSTFVVVSRREVQ